MNDRVPPVRTSRKLHAKLAKSPTSGALFDEFWRSDTCWLVIVLVLLARSPLNLPATVARNQRVCATIPKQCSVNAMATRSVRLQGPTRSVACCGGWSRSCRPSSYHMKCCLAVFVSYCLFLLQTHNKIEASAQARVLARGKSLGSPPEH